MAKIQLEFATDSFVKIENTLHFASCPKILELDVFISMFNYFQSLNSIRAIKERIFWSELEIPPGRMDVRIP